MRILIHSNADSSRPFGTFTRPVWLGEELARLGHEVLHLCPRPPQFPDRAADYAVARSTAGLLSLASPDSKANLRVLDYRPDVLYIHGLPNLEFWFLRALRLRPSFVDAHGSFAMEAGAWGNEKEARKARVTERLSALGAKGIIAASDELRDYIRVHYGVPEDSLHVVGNGVPDHVLNGTCDGERWRERLGLDSELLLLHVAPTEFTSNDLSMPFVQEVVRLLEARGLKQRTVVSGRTEAPPGIAGLGIVDDYFGLVDAADVALLPYPPAAICGGARNKTLEFIARGKAIVSTSEGMRGVRGAQPGTHYVRAETPAEFASAIETLGRDPTARKRLGQAAADLARGQTWSARAREVARVLATG